MITPPPSVALVDKRLEFETLISDTSARLLAASMEAIDATVEAALREVRIFFGADRCALLTLDAEQRRVRPRYVSYGEGIPELPVESGAEEFPWSHQKLIVEHTPVVVSRMADLPPEAARDRESWERSRTRSDLTIPILVESRVVHLIVVHAVHTERDWPQVHVPRLRVLAEVFVNALERRQVHDALMASEARLELAAASAHAGLWELDIATGRIWGTPEARRLYGLGPDEPITREHGMMSVHPDDRPIVERELQRAWTSHSDYQAEYRVVLPDGAERWLAVRGRLFPGADGKPARMLAAAMDISDRKRADAALKESEERFRTVANSAPVLIWMSGPDGLCTFFNKTWLDYTGRMLEQELGNGWADGVHGEDLDRCLEVYTSSLNARQTFTMEYRLRRHDGEYGWVLDTGVPRFAPDGAFLGYTGSCVDITDRKTSEAALTESEARFRQIAESAGEFIWEFDANGLYTYASPSVEKMLGYRPDELVGKMYFYDLFEASAREEMKADVFRAMAERQSCRDIPNANVSRSGRLVHLETSAVPILDAAGNLVGYRGADTDVTDRYRAQEVLQRSEQKFRRLYGSLMDAFVIVDMEGRILEFNPVYQQLLGYSGEELLGLTYAAFTPESWHASEARIIRDQVLARGYSDVYEEEYRKKDGTIIPIELRRFLIRDEAGQPTGMWAIVRDITERKRLESEVRRNLEEVQQLRDRLQQENIYLKHEVWRRQGAELVVGHSPAIHRALTLVEQVSPTNSTVLLLGETGSGKERFATLIHDASRRHERAMIRVNCSAIPSALIESELFGREKGAYTGALTRQVGRFELAHGSTLFLDEIGDLPAEVQVKLLRAIEERTIERLGNPRPVSVDVRIIAATHRDLERAVREGTFREDLYYRLNVFPITVPPLRDRVEDIPVLVNTFMDEFAGTMGKRVGAIAPESLAALVAHPWAGNVRELRNVVERAMILATGPVLTVDLPAPAPSLAAPAAAAVELALVERTHISQVLEECGWRIRGTRGAAERLGLRPTTLEARMKKLGIERPGAARV